MHRVRWWLCGKLEWLRDRIDILANWVQPPLDDLPDLGEMIKKHIDDNEHFFDDVLKHNAFMRRANEQ